jgi:hypothetical protein
MDNNKNKIDIIKQHYLRGVATLEEKDFLLDILLKDYNNLLIYVETLKKSQKVKPQI